MPRPRASVPPDAIRIEDEVWQEAFSRREPAHRRARMRAIEGGRATHAAAPSTEPAPVDLRSAAALAELRAAAVAELHAELAPAPVPRSAAAGRRTVTIRGHGAERNLTWPDGPSRRPQRKPYERAGFQPDRVALWAVMLCVLLVIVAVASPHG